MTIPTPFPPQRMKHSSGITTIDRNSETMRLTGPNGQSVWLQNGQVYDDAGQVMDPPDWFDGEFKKLTKKMQLTHELGGTGQEPKPEAPAPEDDLDSLNKTDLMKVATMEGLEVSQNETKTVIMNKILAKREAEGLDQ